MWPFRDRQDRETPGNQLAATQSGADSHEDAPGSTNGTLLALTTQVAQLRSEVGALQQEWAETLERLSRWGKRQAARERKDLHATLEGPGPEVAEEKEPDPIGGHYTAADRSALKAQLRAKLRGGTR
jgi:hypothetical protein